jgi:hypothetical protein
MTFTYKEEEVGSQFLPLSSSFLSMQKKTPPYK